MEIFCLVKVFDGVFLFYMYAFFLFFFISLSLFSLSSLLSLCRFSSYLLCRCRRRLQMTIFYFNSVHGIPRASNQTEDWKDVTQQLKVKSIEYKVVDEHSNSNGSVCHRK